MTWNEGRLSPCPGTIAQDREGCLPSHICGASRRPPSRVPQTLPALSEVHTPILRKGGKKNFVFKNGLFLIRNHYNESKEFYYSSSAVSPILSLLDTLTHLILLTFSMQKICKIQNYKEGKENPESHHAFSCSFSSVHGDF